METGMWAHEWLHYFWVHENLKINDHIFIIMTHSHDRDSPIPLKLTFEHALLCIKKGF
jgi:hypothetical protein